jgi:hypothetical protein
MPITLDYDVTGLDYGIHTAELQVTHSGLKGYETIPVTVEVIGESPDTDIVPSPMYAMFKYAYNGMSGTAFVKNEALPAGYVVEDIDLSSLMINGTIVPTGANVGTEMLYIGFSVPDFIATYPLMWDTAMNPYTISGNFTDQTPFALDYEVMCIGHISGDANLDGQVNVGDAVFLVNFVFNNGMTPREKATADANCDGKINIADAVRLITYIFRSGDAPCHP